MIYGSRKFRTPRCSVGDKYPSHVESRLCCFIKAEETKRVGFETEYAWQDADFISSLTQKVDGDLMLHEITEMTEDTTSTYLN